MKKIVLMVLMISVTAILSGCGTMKYQTLFDPGQYSDALPLDGSTTTSASFGENDCSGFADEGRYRPCIAYGVSLDKVKESGEIRAILFGRTGGAYTPIRGTNIAALFLAGPMPDQIHRKFLGRFHFFYNPATKTVKSGTGEEYTFFFENIKNFLDAIARAPEQWIAYEKAIITDKVGGEKALANIESLRAARSAFFAAGYPQEIAESVMPKEGEDTNFYDTLNRDIVIAIAQMYPLQGATANSYDLYIVKTGAKDGTSPVKPLAAFKLMQKVDGVLTLDPDYYAVEKAIAQQRIKKGAAERYLSNISVNDAIVLAAVNAPPGSVLNLWKKNVSEALLIRKESMARLQSLSSSRDLGQLAAYNPKTGVLVKTARTHGEIYIIKNKEIKDILNRYPDVSENDIDRFNSLVGVEVNTFAGEDALTNKATKMANILFDPNGSKASSNVFVNVMALPKVESFIKKYVFKFDIWEKPISARDFLEKMENPLVQKELSLLLKQYANSDV